MCKNMSVEKIIKQSELVERAKRGQAYVCKACYTRVNKIILVDYREQTPHGVFNRLCAKCEALVNECKACNKK